MNMEMSAPCLCPYCNKWFDVNKDGGFDDMNDDSIIICQKCYKKQQNYIKKRLEVK